MIMAIHLTGRYVEASAKGALRRPSASCCNGAKQATLLVDGQEYLVPLAQVRIEHAGRSPWRKIRDAVLLEAEGVDESMATGESMPVAKRPGDALIGATVNQGGLLKAQATRVGADTSHRWCAWWAQGTRVPIQALPWVTAIFVPW